MPRYRAYGGPQDGVAITLAPSVNEWLVPYPGQEMPSNVAGEGAREVEVEQLVAVYRVDVHPQRSGAALLYDGERVTTVRGYV